MKAVSVLERFSDHDSIHQKLKKNTASVYSIAQLGRITIHRSAVSTFHDAGFFRHPLLPFRPFSPVVARSSSLSRLLFDLLPDAGSSSLHRAYSCMGAQDLKNL
ncbi:hypothetical protein TNCV_2712831 [Trichonephila clavipes]|uniref:Uncharacterized protein n=1 Tax=Trichonephila clavipes TaxID=2585209 RepID=A0A8X6RIR4_TRICX|nr:hypothetical protein TNCV_2712831 [Trichonephila clavipes]